MSAEVEAHKTSSPAPATESSTEHASGPYWQTAQTLGRNVAVCVDWVVVVLLAVPAFLLSALIGQLSAGASDWPNGEPYSLAFVVWPVLSVIYIGLLEGRSGERNGQTLGKQFADLRTVDAATGLPVGRGRAWARGLWCGTLLTAGIPASLLLTDARGDAIAAAVYSAAVLALLTSAASTSRRTYYDRVLRTAVVESQIKDPAWRSPTDGRAGADHVEDALVPLPIRGLPRQREVTMVALVWLALHVLEALGVWD